MLGLLIVGLAACAGPSGPGAAPPPSVQSPDAPSPSAPESPADVELAPLPTATRAGSLPLHLNVTNQSYGIPEVRLVVELDGDPIIDDRFLVEDQHTWVTYDLQLDPGDHEIVVTAPEHDVDMTETFRIGAERWALVSFWLGESDGSTPFTWSYSDYQLLPM